MHQRTSLKDLLALESSFENEGDLEHKYDKIAHILKLPKTWRLQICTEMLSQHDVCQSRAEWCFKWLLKALTSSSSRPYVRAKISTWILLRHLISRLPVSLVIKTLHANAFIICLKTTLDENYGHESADTLTSILKYLGPDGKQSAHKQFEEVNASNNDSHCLILAIDQLLRCILDLAPSQLTNCSVNEHMKLLLRTDTSIAVKLFRLYVMAINKHLAQSGKFLSNVRDNIIAPAILAWEISLENAQIERELDLKSFSSQCTLPLLYTLLLLSERSSDIGCQYEIKLVCRSRTAIEYLIAKYSLLFAPSCFIKSQKEREQQQEIALKASLYEIVHEVSRLTDAMEEQRANCEMSLSIVARTVPLLYQLILRSKPVAKFGQVEHKSMHIEPILRNLAAALHPRYQTAHKSAPDVCVENLKTLIEIAVDQGISLNVNTLKFIADHFCRLGRENENINWRLVAVLFRLQNDVFFRSLIKAEGQEQAGLPLLDDLLHQLHRRSFELLSSLNSTEFQKNTLAAYRELKVSICYPFLASFIRTKKVTSFISLLRSELQKSFMNSGVDSELPIASVWEDDDTIIFMKKLLRTEINRPESLKLCHADLSAFKMIIKSNDELGFVSGLNSHPDYYTVRTNLIILEILLSSILNDDPMEDLIENIPSAISNLLYLANKFTTSFNLLYCDVLRVLYSLHYLFWRNLDRMDNFASRGQMIFHPWQLKSRVLTRSEKNDNESSSVDLQSQYLTLSFLASSWYEFFVRDMYEYVPLGFANDIISYINGVLQMLSVFPHNATKEIFAWNGCSRWIHSTRHLSQALISVVVQYPQLLSGCGRQDRKGFFLNCCLLAAQSKEKNIISDTTVDVSFSELLVALNRWIGSCSQPDLRGDFLSVLTGLIQSPPSHTIEHAQRISIVAEEQILLSNPLVLGRECRENLLNAMLYMSEARQVNELIRPLSVIIHLMGSSNTTARVFFNAEALWVVAQRLDTLPVIESCNLLQLQDDLVRKTLIHVLNTQDHSRSQKFLRDYVKMMQKAIIEHKSFLSSIATLSILSTSFCLLGTHDLNTPEFEQMLLSTLTNDLTELREQQRHTQGSDVLPYIEAIFSALSLYQVNQTELAQVKNMAHVLLADYSTYPSTRRTLGKFLLNRYDPELMHDFFKAQSAEGKWEAPMQDICLFSRMICKNQALTENNCLERQYKLYKDAKDSKSSAQLFMLREILSLPNIILSSSPDKYFSNLSALLCNDLLEASKPQDILMLLDCINFLLLNKRHSLSQYNVDILLSMIPRSVLALQMAPQIYPASHVFLRLCSLARTIMLSFRTKLSGRHHLLLQTLKMLLSALFQPYKLDNRCSAPRGVTEGSMEITWLGTGCAEAFCRLLTLWSSPPPSSIKAHQKQSDPNLIDYTQRTKAYTGKFGINILEFYCALQLSERTKPEIRNILRPGLFLMLDITKSEAMKALNARLSISAQALWKILYDEWSKSSNRFS